jgi:hypothetical protein
MVQLGAILKVWSPQNGAECKLCRYGFLSFQGNNEDGTKYSTLD